jgi:para-nitrobenzyl esterase
MGAMCRSYSEPWQAQIQRDRQLSAAIQEYWTNFAKTGDRNDGSLPQWPKFNTAARA